MGDSSPKSKNKQQQQNNAKKQTDAANAKAKQAPPAPSMPARKGK